jgi:hypothetical protein
MGYIQGTVGGQDSIVDTVTRYGLDGPGMKSQWGQDILYHPDRPLGPPTHSSARLQMSWNYTSASPLCLHGQVMV